MAYRNHDLYDSDRLHTLLLLLGLVGGNVLNIVDQVGYLFW